MKLRNALRFFRSQPSVEELPIVSAEETLQLDLLLGEIALHEQQLSATHWSARAQAFTDQIASQEAANEAERAARLTQMKPYLASLLPLGGLVALGIALSRPADETSTSATPVTATTVLSPSAIEPGAEHQTPPNGELPRPALEVHVAPSAQITAPAEMRTSAGQAQTARLPRAATNKTKRVVPELASPPVETVAPVPPVEAQAQGAAKPAPSEVTRERDTFGEQLQALKRADKALKSGDNSSARTALSRNFSPQFSLHANALRAVLACQNRDLGVGKRYLEAQAKSNPNSPYLARMRRACGVTEPTND